MLSKEKYDELLDKMLDSGKGKEALTPEERHMLHHGREEEVGDDFSFDKHNIKKYQKLITMGQDSEGKTIVKLAVPNPFEENAKQVVDKNGYIKAFIISNYFKEDEALHIICVYVNINNKDDCGIEDRFGNNLNTRQKTDFLQSKYPFLKQPISHAIDEVTRIANQIMNQEKHGEEDADNY
jgi:hypothetical protein